LQANESVSGLSQPSSPLFLPAVTYASGGSLPVSVAVADMNGDGNPDLVVANRGSNTVGILQGKGNGTFQTAVTYDTVGQLPVSVAVADLHMGGGLQVVVANGCADKSACFGSGASGVAVLFGFGPTATYRSGGSFIQSVKVADVDGNGIPDLLVANACAFNDASQCGVNPNTRGSIGVLLGHDDIFTLVRILDAGGVETASLAVADVNGDGQPDLVVANSCASSTNCKNGSLGVLLGNGDGTFNKAVKYPVGDFPLAVVIADVNGDGKMDVLLYNSTTGTEYTGISNGNGTFAYTYQYWGIGKALAR